MDVTKVVSIKRGLYPKMYLVTHTNEHRRAEA